MRWLVGGLWHGLRVMDIVAFVGEIGMIPLTRVECVRVRVIWRSQLKSICILQMIQVRLILGTIMTKVSLNTTHLTVWRGNMSHGRHRINTHREVLVWETCEDNSPYASASNLFFVIVWEVLWSFTTKLAKQLYSSSTSLFRKTPHADKLIVLLIWSCNPL